MFSSRPALIVGFVFLVGLVAGGTYWVERPTDPLAGKPIVLADATANTAELMAPQALPDVVQGKADAPITMVEYASMTCPHCAHFHATVYPTLLKDYIDTGKVKFILREFPLDPIAAAGFMAARCEGDKRTAVVDLLFDTQNEWAFTQTPLEGLQNILKQTGMDKAAFDKCLSDDKLRDKVYAVADTASKEFHVNATPTFFVNGTKVSGELTVDSLKHLLDPLLVKKS